MVLDGKAAISRALADRTLALIGDGTQRAVPGLQHRTQLRLDPETGRMFQRVESSAPGVRLVHAIDAETGAIIDAWDALDHATPGMGTGVRGDRKSLLGSAGSGDDLTREVNGGWRMQSADQRIST